MSYEVLWLLLFFSFSALFTSAEMASWNFNLWLENEVTEVIIFPTFRDWQPF